MKLQTPPLTLPGIKAFAKMLRSRLNSRHNLPSLPAELVTELVIHGPRVIPTTDGSIPNPEPVTWVIGPPGTGKSTLASFSGLLATANPRRRVIHISEGLESHFSDLCRARGFQVIVPEHDFSGKYLRRLLKSRTHLLFSPPYRPSADGKDKTYQEATEIFHALLDADLHDTLLILDNFPLVKGETIPSLLAPFVSRAGRDGFQIMVVGMSFHVPPIDRNSVGAADAKVVFNPHSRKGHDCDSIPPQIVAKTSGFRVGQAAFVSDDHHEVCQFPVLGSEADFHLALQAWTVDAAARYTSLTEQIRACIADGHAPKTHFQALETSARLLGFSSWHAIEGHLKKKRNKIRRISAQELTRLIIGSNARLKDNDMWTARAIMFVESLIPPLFYLQERGHVTLSQELLREYFSLEALENLVQFGIIVDLDGKTVYLQNDYPDDWQGLQDLMQKLRTYIECLPGYESFRAGLPHRTSRMSEADYRRVTSLVEKEDGYVERQIDWQNRGKLNDQHNFITMKLMP